MRLLVAACFITCTSATARILVDEPGTAPRSHLPGAGRVASLHVEPDPAGDGSTPRYVNFRLVANDRLGEIELSILFDLADDGWIDHPYFKLVRGDRALDADDYVERDALDGYVFWLRLPAIEKGEVVRLSIGWFGAELERTSAYFALETANTQRAWIGAWDGARASKP